MQPCQSFLVSGALQVHCQGREAYFQASCRGVVRVLDTLAASQLPAWGQLLLLVAADFGTRDSIGRAHGVACGDCLVARAKLVALLAVAYGESLSIWMTRQKDACSSDFLLELASHLDRETACRLLDGAIAEFAEATAFVGGGVHGALRSGMSRKLLKMVNTKLSDTYYVICRIRMGLAASAWGGVWGGCTTSRRVGAVAAANPINKGEVGVSTKVSEHDCIILRR